jgi:hypothetical protein
MGIIIAEEGAQIASSFLLFALIAAASIGVFLLIRSIMLWYWRVDKIVENQHAQLAELKRLVDLMAAQSNQKKDQVHT